MIEGLKPYPRMKNSGAQWLREVPEHWAIRRLRHLLRRRTERGRPELPLLSVVREKGVILRDTTSADENHNYIPDDLTNYKVVRVGQFAMNKMKAWQGSYGVSRHEGIVSPAYFVFDLSGVEGDFFHTAIRSKAYVPAFTQASDGVRIGQWDLAETRMREILFAVPPQSEQAAIVRFLGYADRRIRRYIRAKQELIKLLEEQKQAIIHHAVTRGLDPNVRLEASGVEGTGDVPDHWDVVALRRRWSVVDCKHITVPFIPDEYGIPLASVREVQSFDLCLEGAKRTTQEHYELLTAGGRRPRQGDLIYCRNVSVGAAAVVATDELLAMGQDVCLIRSHGENQRYLNYFLRSPAMQHQLRRLLVGSTFKRINVSDVKALTVVVPPREEQDAIVAFLGRELDDADSAQIACKREISLLHEYRTRLIADVVTGKLDVREATARLPDDLNDSEPLDDTDASDADESADFDDADLTEEAVA